MRISGVRSESVIGFQRQKLIFIHTNREIYVTLLSAELIRGAGDIRQAIR